MVYSSSSVQKSVSDNTLFDFVINELKTEQIFYFSILSSRYNSLTVENQSKPPSNEDKYDGKYVKNPQKNYKSIPGYRHSYVEPKMKIEPKKKNMADLLHRTNSTAGYMPPRVGIASVHPY